MLENANASARFELSADLVEEDGAFEIVFGPGRRCPDCSTAHFGCGGIRGVYASVTSRSAAVRTPARSLWARS